MSGRFDGRLAVVTGAARGIGAATARRLLADGAEVIAVDKLPFTAEETFAELSGRATAVSLDVSQKGAARAIMQAAGREGATIDFLINNAGIGGARSLADTSDEDWERFLQVNLSSVFRLCRDFLPWLRTPGGRIVNVSSIYGLTGFPGSLAYGVTKAGVAQLTRQIAVDLAPKGILVNAIAPGVIETDMTRRRINEDAWYKAVQIDATPVGRVGTPADIAGVAAFLCSDDAGFIAGQVIAVDGGWLATRYRPRDE